MLSFVWLILVAIDLVHGLTPLWQHISLGIWIVFIVDFLVELLIAPNRWAYLKQNWLTALSILLPAFRILRVFRAFRILQAAKATRSLSLLRLLTSIRRGMGATAKTLQRRGFGYVVGLTAIITFSGAAGMALFESPAALREAGITDAKGLQSYGDALWWTAMMMTTMGSDYWPKTVEGRILGWLIAVYAFAVFGYITATIASHFIRVDQSAKGGK